MKRNWLKILIFAVLIGATVWAGKGIFKYSVFSTHDGDHHIARAFDAIQSIKEGEFPLRWAGSLDYFCGVPVYNFYYPLLYYLVILGNIFFNNVIFSFKIIFFLSLLLGTVGFYLWAKEETGKVLPAIAGAMVYLFAPYRFILIFVRGSPEYLAFAILPLVLFLYSKAFHSSGKKFVLFAFLASLMGAILTISHNFTAMFLMPIILLYLVVKILLAKPGLKKIALLAFSFIGAFGMGSFFIGPALLEQKFTKIGSDFLMWRDHFPELWQLWNSKWGYFYSSSGTINDGMSFMLGYAQWVILALAAVFIIYRLIKSKFKLGFFIKENVWILIFFIGTLFTIYLILPWSIPVWEKIRLLQEIQFSWRLLGVAVFTIAALFTFVLDKIKSKYLLVGLSIGISLFAVFAERNHLLPQPVSSEDVYRYADFEKLHPHRYSTTTLGDEIIASGATKACWFSTPVISTDKGETVTSSIVERGNTFGSVKFLIDKKKIIGDKIVLALGYFPDIHKISLNGGRPLSYSDCNGQVCFDAGLVKDGENFISWKVGQSKIELAFDYLTLAFFFVWIVVLIAYLTGIYKNKKNLTYFVLTILIALIFVFFRSYNLSGRVGFGWDQERDAVAATNILAGKLTLIGPRVQGPDGFFLPPYFFYMIAPFYALTAGSPMATTIFIIFWSFLFFVVSYSVLTKVFNKNMALFFLALWAVNPLSVSMDTIAWNPVVIPLLFILLIYLIHLYFKNHRIKYAVLAGLTFGLGASFHLQFLFIFPIFIPVIADILRSKRFKDLISFAAASLLPFLPIAIFDLRHNFLNISKVVQFIKSGDMGINRVMTVWGNIYSFAVGRVPSNQVGLIVYVLVLFGLFLVGARLKDRVQRKIIIGLGYTWAFSLPLFYLLIKNPSEYYFNYLVIPFIVLLSILLNKWKRFGVILLVGILVYFVFWTSRGLSGVQLSLWEKDQAIGLLSKISKNSTPFNVSFDVPFNEDAGFRYLLNYYKVGYSGSIKDPLIEFVIPYQKRSETFVVGQIGIYVPTSWLNTNWSGKSK
jgi:hypothetical protein